MLLQYTLAMKYKDPVLPIQQRVEDLISRMTLEEKVGQMMQLPANEEENIPKLEKMHIGSYLHCSKTQMKELQERALKTRLGIPLIFGIDAIHGHCFEERGTVFPTQLAISCSWDRDLIKRAGEITAAEVRGTGIHWTFSPVLCVARDMRWGRVDETFGEDPWLNGELAAEMIRGYQRDGDLSHPEAVLACAKHFAAYGESKGGRDSYDTDISWRTMESLFLPPFKKAVDSGCATLMAGYQAIEGLPCSANPRLLRETAKNRWEFDGFIVTDWDNVGSLHTRQLLAKDYRQAAKYAIEAGNDMIMNTPTFYQHAIDLVESGEVDESYINDSASRILKAKFLLGLFENPRAPEHPPELGKIEYWSVSEKASEESLVLVKNSGILPINKQKIKHILLTGPNCDDVVAQLGDWSFRSKQLQAKDDKFHKEDSITLLEGMKERCDEYGIKLSYIKGADTLDKDFEELEAVRKTAAEADLVIACVGDTMALHGEGLDQGTLDLTGKQQELLETAAESGTPLVTVLMSSKPLTVPWVKENSEAVFISFNPGGKGGRAIAKALFGEINPQGKLTVSFPVHVGQQPVHYNKYPGWHAENSGDLPGDSGYRDLPREPLWSFGQGMGYSAFEYSNFRVCTPELRPGDSLQVNVDITNTGEYEGVEIVQLYIRDCYGSVTRPVKELKGFCRVNLSPGETKTISLDTAFDELSLVNARLERVVEPGEFEAMIGPSSRDTDLLKERFTVTAQS